MKNKSTTNAWTCSEDDEALLLKIQRNAFDYFLCHFNPKNGLIADSSRDDSPSSIAATGLALSCYPIAVERGFLKRDDALHRSLITLRFFYGSEQSTAKDATGYKGFYYHFLDFETGKRTWNCELSSIDTALLMVGILTVAAYFDADTVEERELRDLAQQLFDRTDWKWMCDGQLPICLGWKPGREFLPYHWSGYNEALILYILGLGAKKHALPRASYDAWVNGFKWKKIYGYEFAYAGPLFIHQLSHCWLDLRDLPDKYMRSKNSDYFMNSRRATYIQREYAIRNPRDMKGYGENCWGITACDGPGSHLLDIDSRERRFYAYKARGVPFGPDDGTISPWVVVASLPFCPEIVLPAIHAFENFKSASNHPAYHGFETTFNPTYTAEDTNGWACSVQLGVNVGPMVLMIENYLTGFVWRLLKESPVIKNGLRRAGFEKI